jgi:hypothetical protein
MGISAEPGGIKKWPFDVENKNVVPLGFFSTAIML